MNALRKTSLSVSPNDFVSLVGPSGCGKTTLLKLIGDIINPTTGTVAVDGAAANDVRRAGHFGYVFQTPALLPWRTVERNVQLPFEVGGRSGMSGTEGRSPDRLCARDRRACRLRRQATGGAQWRHAGARFTRQSPCPRTVRSAHG